MNQRPYVEIACRMRHSLSHLILLFIRQTESICMFCFVFHLNGPQEFRQRDIHLMLKIGAADDLESSALFAIQLRRMNEEQIVTGFS